MNCPRCGTAHLEPAQECRRCASSLPQPRCKKCKASIDWNRSYCERHQPKEQSNDEYCPACGVENHVEADYCAACGSPMAVITRVVDTSDGDRHPDPWRVYGVETSLIGRDDELEILEATLDEVTASSSSRVALIAGKQGLGKSRLLAEFQRRLEASFSETAVLRGVCREEVGGAFAVISRMLRTRFYIPDGDSTEMARRRLVEAVEALIGSEEATPIGRQVGELIGLPFPDQSFGPDEPTGEISPGQRERRCFRAIARLLRADANRNPLLIILDDVHLAPDTTHRLLQHLIDELADAPVFFVLGCARGADPGLAEDEVDLDLELAPLSDAEVRRQVQDTLRLADDLPDNLVDNIVDAALGNPLAVEEMLRIFISEGIIDTRAEPWTIDAGRIHDIDLPTTVEETVKARLNEGLTETERMALEMAACVGTLFWKELLRCLNRLRRNASERPDSPWMLDATDKKEGRNSVEDVIESLERKDMIRGQSESRLAGHQEFFFKHRLEQKALYDGLPPRVRQRYHRLIAQWVEREIVDTSDGAAEFIARHYSRARCHRRAGERFLDAGDDARRHHANQKAIELYTQALGCLSDADIGLKMRAFHDLGSVHALLGEHGQAKNYFQDMARYAWLVGDRAKGGAALNKFGRVLRGFGQYDESIEHFERALELFRDTDDERGVASTLDDIGKIHWIRGKPQQALDYYSASLEMRRRLNDQRSIALSLSHIGSLELSLGNLEEAMTYFRESLELSKEIDDHRGLASSYNDMGGLCVERGEYEKALPFFDKALVLAREIGFRTLEGAILNNTGEALIELKRREQARDYLDRAMKLAADIGNQRVLFDVSRNLATIAVSNANRDLALGRIDEALEIARQMDSLSYIAIGELTRAGVHAEYIFDPALKEQSIDEATSAFEKAIELLDETGADVQLATALSNFGHFLVESGSSEQARSHLQRAAKLFADLGMDRRREEAEDVLITL